MNFEEFESNLLYDLKEDKKSCLDLIEQNKKIVQEYFLFNESFVYVKGFVTKLNDIIFELKKYKLVTKVLNHALFKNVLVEFKNTNILVRACKDGNNKYLIEWLLTMEINPYVQDENGMTALMHAAEHHTLQFVVEKLIKHNDEHINLTDNDGNTAIFHAYKCKSTMEKMLKAKFNINHLNKENENLLTFICKHDKLSSFDDILSRDIDYNVVSKSGMTPAMYLVKNGRYTDIDTLVKKGLDPHFKNNSGEDLVFTYFKQYANLCKGGEFSKFNIAANYFLYRNITNVLKKLIEYGCDFNEVIDDEGNTPIIMLLMFEDYLSAHYLLSNCKNIDLSIKNKNGINASILSTLLNEKVFENLNYHKKKYSDKLSMNTLRNLLINNETFDFNYLDENNNNLLNYAIVNNSPLALDIISKMKDETLNAVNNKNETSLTLAAKFGNYAVVRKIFDDERKCDINHQDELGNTPLYYAIKLKDKRIVNFLLNKNADIKIENKCDVSASDVAMKTNDEAINEIIKSPISPSDMEKNMTIRSKKESETEEEKLEKYIKEYQNNNLYKDYENLLNVKKSYTTDPSNVTVFEQWIIEILYPNAGGDVTVFSEVTIDW